MHAATYKLLGAFSHAPLPSVVTPVAHNVPSVISAVYGVRLN